jgi:glycosyltransferase involved in cell wall biosynthesis
MKPPFVTVYITNYNYERFIRQSIESVLNQTLQDFELLIIDDGSKDNSKNIIEEYRDHPKITIIYQQNKGLNITNNIAMRAASGTYLMRLDADDYLEPSALETMSAILDADLSLGLVFPDYYYVDIDGIRTGEERRHNFEKEVSLYDQPAHGACTMIRLEFLRRLGGYNESFTCQDGYDLWIKFITHFKVTNITQPLFSYRRHGLNLTTNEERILDTRKKIKELFVDEHMEIPPTLAVIPVRQTYIGKVSWPLYEWNCKTVIEHKVDDCLKARRVTAIAITSADTDILDFCRSKYADNPNVHIIERPRAFENVTETLAKTLEHALVSVPDWQSRFTALMSVSIDYPFVTPDIIDDAVNTLVLFKSDAVLSVRPDNKMYYQHTGHSLQPILDQEKFTRLEREAIYKGAGGIAAGRIESFHKYGSLLGGSISHIVVDNKNAFGVYTDFDLRIVQALNTESEASVLTN